MTEGNGSAATARPPNILIVDDSAMMRALIRGVVGLTNVRIGKVYEAANGSEAIKVLETCSVQVVFTDINMPVMSGMELLREIARRDAWKGILRVVVSTDGTKLRRDEAEKLHVNRYVEKPFRPEAVRDVLLQITSPDLS
jgi:two-component system, chemotaxis family, chemotaxis protein CheY